MIKLVIGKGYGGLPTWDIPLSDQEFTISAAANLGTTLVIPKGATTAIISYTPGATVLVSDVAMPGPPASSWVKTNGQLNMDKITVTNSSNLYFYPLVACVISVGFYE